MLNVKPTNPTDLRVLRRRRNAHIRTTVNWLRLFLLIIIIIRSDFARSLSCRHTYYIQYNPFGDRVANFSTFLAPPSNTFIWAAFGRCIIVHLPILLCTSFNDAKRQLHRVELCKTCSLIKHTKKVLENMEDGETISDLGRKKNETIAFLGD